MRCSRSNRKEQKIKYQKYRLTKQIRNYDCAPAALVNTMKLCGSDISYKSAYQGLFSALDVQENKGTYISIFERFIAKHKILNRKLMFVTRNSSVKEIEKSIDSGTVAILAFGRGHNKSGHVCVIAGYNREGLEIVNWDKKETIQTVGFDRFKKNVLDYKDATYYFFKKEKKNEVKKSKRRTKRIGS